jgi:hypothetical protein
MSYEISDVEEQGFVRVVYDGELDLDELVRSRSESMVAMQAKGLRRVLVEMGGAVDRLSTADRYEFVSSHGSVVPPATRIAVVANDRNLHLPDRNLIENVARNRGIDLRLFREVREARSWLLDS